MELLEKGFSKYPKRIEQQEGVSLEHPPQLMRWLSLVPLLQHCTHRFVVLREMKELAMELLSFDFVPRGTAPFRRI